jgi:hypothetical protein
VEVEVFVATTPKRIARYASRGRTGNCGYVAGRKLTTDSYAMDEGRANDRAFPSPRSSHRSSLSSPRSGSTLRQLQWLALSPLPASSFPCAPRPPHSTRRSREAPGHLPKPPRNLAYVDHRHSCSLLHSLPPLSTLINCQLQSSQL